MKFPENTFPACRVIFCPQVAAASAVVSCAAVVTLTTLPVAGVFASDVCRQMSGSVAGPSTCAQVGTPLVDGQ